MPALVGADGAATSAWKNPGGGRTAYLLLPARPRGPDPRAETFADCPTILGGGSGGLRRLRGLLQGVAANRFDQPRGADPAMCDVLYRLVAQPEGAEAALLRRGGRNRLVPSAAAWAAEAGIANGSPRGLCPRSAPSPGGTGRHHYRSAGYGRPGYLARSRSPAFARRRRAPPGGRRRPVWSLAPGLLTRNDGGAGPAGKASRAEWPPFCEAPGGLMSDEAKGSAACFAERPL